MSKKILAALLTGTIIFSGIGLMAYANSNFFKFEFRQRPPQHRQEDLETKQVEKDEPQTMPSTQQDGNTSEEATHQSMGSLSVKDANSVESKYVKSIGYKSQAGGYPIVDTNQTTYYNNTGVISSPSTSSPFYGQDATYMGNSPSYINNKDGTVTDLVTGLMWQQDPGEKMTWLEAIEGADSFELAGYDDWRLPTIKELYSLIQFSGVTGMSAESSVPYLDEDYFSFTYGDVTGERYIDSQFATSTIYESDTMNGNATMFGVNFADGRIKGYPADSDLKSFYVLYVRGNTSYGINQFVDNENGTITDEATELMWLDSDSGFYLEDGTMDWEAALLYAENFSYAGYDDWRLPNAKELQSLVDYKKSPDTTQSAAIDDLFSVTSFTDLKGQTNYPYYWTSTTHNDGKRAGAQAVYVSFGEALGEMNGKVIDVHGAGAQRSDPKTGDRDDYPSSGYGPQGDVRMVYNYVILVRDAK